jgi:uncharacterized membrane protein
LAVDGMTVTYLADDVDITDSVVSGTYEIDNLAPKASVTIVVRVTVDASVAAGRKQIVVLSASSANAPSRVDVVRAVTKT